jgi:F-type H+-transporting ATPase subunit b
VDSSWTQRTLLRPLVVAAVLLVAQPALAAGSLELIPEVPLLVSLIVLFLVLVIPVNALLLKPLLKVLDERTEKIDGTRSQADKLEREATEILDRYETAVRVVREESEQQRRGVLEGARGQSSETTGAARKAAEQQIDEARREVGAALEQARSGLRTQAEDLAQQAATQVLGRAL